MTSAFFDPETGEVMTRLEGECVRCAESLRERLLAEQDLQRVERDLRNARREISRLKTEIDKRERASPSLHAAEALFRYWIVKLAKNPNRTVFGDKRRKAVLARLTEHDPEYIARAIDGFALSIYTAPNGKVFDDLELVCRDEVKLESCYELAERIGAPTLLGPAWRDEFGSRHIEAT